MILSLVVEPQELYLQLHELIRMSFPDHELHQGDMPDANVQMEISRRVSGERAFFSASIKDGHVLTDDSQEYRLELERIPLSKELARLAKIFTYHLLCRHTGKNINPYGILTGVCPLKLLHRWLDQGDSMEQILARLEEDYCMESLTADRLAQIARNNRPFLHSPLEAKRTISIYIGIPFCPSRCYYCSFPGAILKNYDSEMKPFLQSLQQEIEGISECINDLGLIVENIYWGGGTPSILVQDDLEGLFDLLRECRLMPVAGETTVEAGRPDTLSLSKLKLYRDLGVDRICINPQTMQDATLKLIGRNHSRDDIIKTVQQVREAGIPRLNMDLIIGLPGEGMEEYQNTLSQILDLRPENITVHSLAVKKGSRLAAVQGKSQVDEQVDDVKAGLHYISKTLQEKGYQPYYLYRQKYMKANVENIGYSLPGHFCNYNIQVMEERQTIIGLGGGASSKFVSTSDWSLNNLHSPKEPLAYTKHLPELLARKVDKLKALN